MPSLRQRIRDQTPIPLRRVARWLRLSRALNALPPDTEDARADWATTRDTSQLESYAAAYMASTRAPQRDLLLEHFAQLGPLTSFLELGCHVGPNLRRIAEDFPDAEIVGVDTNPQLVSEGTLWLSGFQNVRLVTNDMRAYLREAQSQSFDCVFSLYSLAYIGPRHIVPTLRDAWRVSRRALVIFEPQVLDGEREPLEGTKWRHDYPRILRGIVAGAELRVQTVPPERRNSEANAITTVRRGV